MQCFNNNISPDSRSFPFQKGACSSKKRNLNRMNTAIETYHFDLLCFIGQLY